MIHVLGTILVDTKLVTWLLKLKRICTTGWEIQLIWQIKLVHEIAKFETFIKVKKTCMHGHDLGQILFFYFYKCYNMH